MVIGRRTQIKLDWNKYKFCQELSNEMFYL